MASSSIRSRSWRSPTRWPAFRSAKRTFSGVPWAKKKPEEMEKLRVKFLEGARQKKIAEKKAEKLYELIQKFAGYGFNKSHAAAYAVVCYHTGYLKAHYPTEFMAALMTTDMGNADKIVGYFTECRDLGIQGARPRRE